MASAEIYDAVIVGSGATGGWVAKTLSEAGMKTLVLEAGPVVTDADFTEHVQPYDLKYRGASPAIARNRPIQAMKYATSWVGTARTESCQSRRYTRSSPNIRLSRRRS